MSRAAVARVIAAHLIDTGERPYDSVALDRQLKDRVGRALSGRTVSSLTLQWIIDAFDIDEDDASALWRLFFPPTRREEGYRNVALHELHTLGSDGRPATHRTVQVLQAGHEPLDHLTYRFDTDAADVTILRGGRAGPVYSSGDGHFATDIAFHRTLQPGQPASLEYLTTFHYEELPPPELRRVVSGQIERLELRVQFHPDRLPRQVWWAEWPALDAPPSSRGEVELDADHAAHRFLRDVEPGIVGFTWRW